MATSIVKQPPIYNFSKDVTIPGNSTGEQIDLTNDIPNLSKMKGFDVGFEYGANYWNLTIVRKVMDKVRPMVYISNSNSNDINHTLRIVVFY